MQLPTKNEVVTGLVFAILGLITLGFFPNFSNSGWYAIIFGVTYFLFPGPQLRQRYKQTEEIKARWRESAKVASLKGLTWWLSPLPWMLFIIFAVFIFAVVT